jgi:hypothetical protein
VRSAVGCHEPFTPATNLQHCTYTWQQKHSASTLLSAIVVVKHWCNKSRESALPCHVTATVASTCAAPLRQKHSAFPPATKAQRISTCNKSTPHFHLQQKHSAFPPATNLQHCISTCNNKSTAHFHLQQKHSAFPPATKAQRISTCNRSTAHFHLQQKHSAFPPALPC